MPTPSAAEAGVTQACHGEMGVCTLPFLEQPLLHCLYALKQADESSPKLGLHGKRTLLISGQVCNRFPPASRLGSSFPEWEQCPHEDRPGPPGHWGSAVRSPSGRGKPAPALGLGSEGADPGAYFLPLANLSNLHICPSQSRYRAPCSPVPPPGLRDARPGA